MLKYILQLLFLSFGTLTFSQYKLNGLVLDQYNTPIKNAVITANNIVVKTNYNGSFSINLPFKNIKIKITAISFESEMKLISETDFNTNFIIHLEKKSTELEEVIVKSKIRYLPKHQEKTLPVYSISTKFLQNTSKNIDQILNTQSGIKIFRNGGEGAESNYMINGLSGKSIRFFYDEIPFEYSGYGKNPATIPANFFQQIDIYKGVSPTILGTDALGGAIHMKTKNTHYPLRFSYGIGSFDTHKLALLTSVNLSETTVLDLKTYYTSSENNYKVGGGNNKAIYVVDDFGNKEYIKTKSFHNAFETFYIRPSLSIKSPNYTTTFWSSFSNLKKEIQQNRFNPEIVVGEAFWTNKQLSLGLNFNCKINSDTNFKTNFSYTYDKLYLKDISKNSYNWKGSIIGENNVGGEILNYVSRPFDIEYSTKKYFLNTFLVHNFNSKHSLNLNVTSTFDARKTNNNLEKNNLKKPSTYLKSSIVSSLNSQFFKGNLHHTLSLKYFSYLSSISEFDAITFKPLKNKPFSDYLFGFNEAIRLKLAKKSILKASYEYAIRLPDTDELFGNGFFYFPNSNLKPERSYNVNIGFAQNFQKITFETNLFHRNTKNKILLLGTDFRNPKYENKSNITTNGIEFSLHLKPYKFFTSELNCTLQDLRYKPVKLDEDYFLYNDRMPNTPFVFGNFKNQVKLSNLFSENTVLLNYNIHYTHEYFRLWESQGLRSSKGIIPEQISHNFSIQFSHKNYVISSEVRNILNTNTYDRFLTQLSGRSYYIKAILKIK